MHADTAATSYPVPRFQIVGEDAKEKGTKRFLPFYFRVCLFSIQRTRLSRSLEQATASWLSELDLVDLSS